ncbi:MAG: haloacid dehalogenase-like hydrolase [Candidatus Daviesbacteria bacterium]|nr:haloacid dehalogenase-like hydrolase [Candidatus Daviesbacteria bacterium]
MNERRLALADIDGTLYEGIMLLSFASFQEKEGSLSQFTLNQIIFDIQKYKEGKCDYETFAENVLISWAQGLKNFSYSKTLDQARRFLKDIGNTFYPETSELITLLNKTHDVFFVTGEPQFLGQVCKDFFQIKGFVSSEFEVQDDNFTGNILKSLARREEKQKAIDHLIKNIHFEDQYLLVILQEILKC